MQTLIDALLFVNAGRMQKQQSANEGEDSEEVKVASLDFKVEKLWEWKSVKKIALWPFLNFDFAKLSLLFT